MMTTSTTPGAVSETATPTNETAVPRAAVTEPKKSKPTEPEFKAKAGGRNKYSNAQLSGVKLFEVLRGNSAIHSSVS